MPKVSTITKEIVFNAAFEIVRTSGFSSLSARNIAQHIGCSTQPIYWVYDNMELLRHDVAQRSIDYLNGIISNYHQTGNTLTDLGLGYIYVAHKESLLFKAIYNDNIANIKFSDFKKNPMIIKALELIWNTNSIDDTATKAWIFAHGIASLVAAGMMVYDSAKIEKLLLSFME